MRRLERKVALITGGGTGIGRACAQLFANEGARVVVAGRRAEPLRTVVEEIRGSGGEALEVVCDVTRSSDVERAVQEVESRFGRLNVVVNSAGMLHVSTVEGIEEAEWDHLMAVNLRGPYLVSRAALPAMRRAGGGAIVNIGSVLGLVAMKNRAAYAASKGGVALLTKAMALDHAHEKIRVNCICPAIVETKLVQGLFAQAPDREAARRMRIAQIPLGRMGQPQDVAQMALFLASDESWWVTGAAMPLDGGLTAY